MHAFFFLYEFILLDQISDHIIECCRCRENDCILLNTNGRACIISDFAVNIWFIYVVEGKLQTLDFY
jgi:hypothetical protein